MFASTIGLWACAEQQAPESQEPVDLLPGQYEISTAGRVFSQTTKPKLGNALCVSEFSADDFAYELAERALKFNVGCMPSRQERVGNAIAGAMICPTDPKFNAGAVKMFYSGVIAAESVKIEWGMETPQAVTDALRAEGRNSLETKLGAKAVEKLRTVINAKRSGEC
ncbi:MAG: hypothetical protein AAF850_06590 [Pseudomonadota bacterium]